MTREPTASARALAPQQRLAERYRVTGHLGNGGFAEVYDGLDELLGRPVAIKILRLDLLPAAARADASALLERFAQEARLAAQIAHPNVVTIYDFGALEQRPYIVMERLHGHDLAIELQQRGPLAPARLWPLFARALDGLAAAHDRHIVHKDLKPANLFLTTPGHEREDLRLLDFGVARLGGQAQDVALTTTGQVVGTARYLAPEYIQDNKNVSPALDVYQMGLILVELLTGQPVVDADNAMACAYLHIKGDLTIPEALRRSPLGPVLRRALALDPADRYPDARRLREALLAIDPDTLWGANPAPPRRPWLLPLALLAALALAAALTALAWSLIPPGEPPKTPLATPDLPLDPTPKPALEPDPTPAPAPDLAITPDLTPPPPLIHTLETQPPGAKILLASDRTLLGEAPLALTWPPDAEALEILIEKPGFQPQRHTLHRDDAPRRPFVLRQLPRRGVEDLLPK